MFQMQQSIKIILGAAGESPGPQQVPQEGTSEDGEAHEGAFLDHDLGVAHA